MELKFAILDRPGPAIEFLFWEYAETTLLGQILAGSLLELKFAILDGPGLLRSFGMLLGTSGKLLECVWKLLELKFAILDGPGPAIEFLFWE